MDITNAESVTDGAANTAAIVAALGPGTTYAAGICDAYALDSQGNSPCQAGNTCYNDWFLPAGNNLTNTGQLNCLYTNRAAIPIVGSGFWSSTEVDANDAWYQQFATGDDIFIAKGFNWFVRCVRAFTP